MNRVPQPSDCLAERKSCLRKGKQLNKLCAATAFIGLALSGQAVKADTPVLVSTNYPNSQVAALSSSGSVIATWIGLGGDTSWNNPANWDLNIAPNGSTAEANFSTQSGGPMVTLGGATVTVSKLTMSDPIFSSITGGTINLVGSAIVHADGANFDLPDKIFPSFGSTGGSNPRPGNNIGGAASLAAAFTGNAGLNKTGDSHLQINSQQFYTGTTSITGGGKIITTVGDGAFGAAGNQISLNNGSIQVGVTNWATSRTINIGSQGGSIYWVDQNRTFTMNNAGNFAGNGTLILNGRYGTKVGVGTILSSNPSFTGVLNIGGGTVALANQGAFLNVPTIINSGSLILDSSVPGSTNNHIGDNVPIIMRGAALTLRNANTAYTENLGSIVLDGGVSMITMSNGTANAIANFGTLSRNNKAGVAFRGNKLGTGLAGSTTITIANGTSLLVNDILPFAWVNGSFTSSSSPESADNLLATYGANGVAAIPIGSYASNFTGATSDTYVRVTANTTGTGTIDIKALVISAPATHTAGSTFSNGMTVTVDQLNVASGVILSAHAGFQSTGGGTIVNALPGNNITGTLNFGSQTAYILTPSALELNGVIKGTGGLVKLGGRTAEFKAASTYTGTTYLTGFNRFSGNVANGSAGPFGSDTSAIVLYGGNATPNATSPVETTNGTGLAVLGSNTPGIGSTFSRNLSVRGDWVQLRNYGAGTLSWNGDIDIPDSQTLLMFLQSTSAAHQVVNGNITGQGRVVIGAIDPNPLVTGNVEETWVDLMSANSFQGGLVISGGTVGLGSDDALGADSGSVQFNGDGMITALNAPRTITNDIVIYNATFGVGGNHEMTFAGEINGRGGDYIANITNTATTTFSSSMTGGGLYKQGTGTLVLSGNNTFTGALSVGNGSLVGGMVIARSSTALGSLLGPTGVSEGSTLALDQKPPTSEEGPYTSLTIGEEALYFRGDGVENKGALRNLNLHGIGSLAANNVWGGIVRPSARYNGEGTANPTVAIQHASIGVDANSTLTINGGVLADDPGALNNQGTMVFLANSIGLRKVGEGTLVLGSHVVNTQIGGSTVNWNGAILASGSLDIQRGTIRIKSQAGIPTFSAGKSIVDVGSINIAIGTTGFLGQLDLNDNPMIIENVGTAPASSTDATNLRAMISGGYASGAWNGNGITSSMAATSPNGGEEGRTGLGYGQASMLGISDLFGDPINGEALVVVYTYAGDANLDGMVNAVDLGMLAQNWLLTPPTRGFYWWEGDFNYDGFVNVLDTLLMGNNWFAGLTDPLFDSLAFGEALAAMNLPPVGIPEPNLILSLMGFGIGAGLLRRRVRYNRR